MRNFLSKIIIVFIIVVIYSSCNSTKKVPEDKRLLIKNELVVNDTVLKSERIESLLYQKPNSKIPLINFPLRLYLFNLAKENADSSYNAWLERKPNRRKNLIKVLSKKQVERLGESFIVSGMSRFLKKTGEAPVIIDAKRVENSKKRLKYYYTYNKGFFDVEVNSKIDSTGYKKGKVTYSINTGNPYILDTISRRIDTPELDSLYATIKNERLFNKGEVFNAEKLDLERQRITNHFRNNGVYHFQVNNIGYEVYDTLNPYKNYKLNVITTIENRDVKKGDTIVKEPFKIFKIGQVNIFTTNTSKKDNETKNDSINYKGYTIYSKGKLNYKPRALTNAIFINQGDYFSDDKRKLTSTAINNLRIFNYPTVEFVEDTINGKSELITNIYLVPRKKFTWSPYVDFSHSNIQDFGITGGMGVTFRNLFKGAEILELTGRGNIGSSRDLANPNNTFFNIFEYGGNAKITFPRIFFPLKTTSFIKKEMFPSTNINVGFYNQQNIGLDKQSLSGGINYNWTTNKRNNFRFDLININYVQNLNIGNYFNVYKTSYNTLNDIAQTYNINPNNFNEDGNLTDEGTLNFMIDVLSNQTSLNQNDSDYKSVLSISERYTRLIENNLIVSSSFTFNRTTRNNQTDNNYYNFRTKLESAGNLLSLLSKTTNNTDGTSAAGNEKMFGIEYSQYIKGEVEYVKLWDLGHKNSIAMRTFGGIAIPYGNGTSIPFSRSYFGGGSNDNRGWQAYSLGPGRSGSIFDFNEANMKIAFSTEYRFNFFGQLNGALFADVGNIWNVFDNVEDPAYTFNGFESLKDLAVGSGIGFRYDFNYFIFRIDLGFKTYNPAKEEGERWFKDMSFAKTVLNFGINYPF